jgi:F0F1-type ATP synthase epsilon subunit
MNLTVLTPKEKKTFYISWIEVETTAGNFVIQKDHVPTILALLAHQPITICLSNGKIDSFSSPGGILEIQRDTALLLLNE